MGIVTAETLSGVAWILAGVWGVVKLIETWLDHKQNLGWSREDKMVEKLHQVRNELEEVKKERDMMLAHFFPEKNEVATSETPVKKKRGRPRKKR